MGTSTITDAAAITEHNRELWDRCAPTYATGFEALTTGASSVLLDLAGVGTGTDMLDVGTGPGTLIGPALDRGALVEGVDLSPQMVAHASARHSGVVIVVGDATALARPDDSVDAITMGFCLHHIPDPEAVLAEAHRVLRPGGRLALAVWSPNEQLEAFGLAFGAIADVIDLGGMPDLQPPAIGSEPADYIELLTRSGFAHAHARTVDLCWALSDGGPMFDGFVRFLDLANLDTAKRDVIRQQMDDQITQRHGPDRVALIPNPAIVAAGAKV